MDNDAHLRALDAQIFKLREEIHQATSSVAEGHDRCDDDVFDGKREIMSHSAGVSEDGAHQKEKPGCLESCEKLSNNNARASSHQEDTAEERGGDMSDGRHRGGEQMLDGSTTCSTGDAEKALLAGIGLETITKTRTPYANDLSNTIDKYDGAHHNAGSPSADFRVQPIIGLPPLSPRFHRAVLRSDSPPPNPIDECPNSNYCYVYAERSGSDDEYDGDGRCAEESLGQGIETARVLRRIQLSSSPTFLGAGIGVGTEEAPATSMRDVANMHNTFTRILSSDGHLLDSRAAEEEDHFSGSPVPAEANDCDDRSFACVTANTGGFFPASVVVEYNNNNNNMRVCSSSSLHRASDHDDLQHHLDRGHELSHTNIPFSSGQSPNLHREDDEDMAEADAFNEGSPRNSSPLQRGKIKGPPLISSSLPKPDDDDAKPTTSSSPHLLHQQALPSNTCLDVSEEIDPFKPNNGAAAGGTVIRDTPLSSGKRTIQPLPAPTLPRRASKQDTPRDRALSGASVFSYSSGIVYEAGEIDMDEVLRQDQVVTDERVTTDRNIAAESASSPSPCGQQQKPAFSHSPIPGVEVQADQPSQGVMAGGQKSVNSSRNDDAPQIAFSTFSPSFSYGPPATCGTYAEVGEFFAASISVASMLYETALIDKYDLFMGSQRVALVSEIHGLRAAMKALEGDRAAFLNSIQTAGVEAALRLREAEEGAKAMERRALEAEQALKLMKTELAQARARQEELAEDLVDAKAKAEHNDLRVCVTAEEPIRQQREREGVRSNENQNTTADNAIAMFVVSPLTPAAPLRLQGEGGQGQDQVSKNSNGTNKDDTLVVSFGDGGTSTSESRPRDGPSRSVSYMYSDTSSFATVSSVSRSRPSAATNHASTRARGGSGVLGQEESIDGDDDSHINLLTVKESRGEFSVSARSATALDATARPSSHSLSALSAMSVSVSRGHSTATATKSPSITPARHNHQHHAHRIGLSEESQPHLLQPSSQEEDSMLNTEHNNNTTTNSKIGGDGHPSTSIYVPPSGRYTEATTDGIHSKLQNPPSTLDNTETVSAARASSAYLMVDRNSNSNTTGHTTKDDDYGTAIGGGGGEERSCTRFSIPPPPPPVVVVSSLPFASSESSVSIARYSVSTSVPPTAPPWMGDEALAMPTTATSALRRSSTVLRAVSSDDLPADRDCDHEEPPAVRPSVTFALSDEIVENYTAHNNNDRVLCKDDLPVREATDTVMSAITYTSNGDNSSEEIKVKEASKPEPHSSSASVLRRSSSFSQDSAAPTNASTSAFRKSSGGAASYVPSSSAVKNWPGNTSRSASSSTISTAATKTSRPPSDFFSNKGIGSERRSVVTAPSVSHSSSTMPSQSGKALDGRPSHAGLKVRDDRGQISDDPHHFDLGYGSSPILIESDPLRLLEDKALLDSFVASVANALALSSGQRPKEQAAAASLVSHLETNFNDKLRLARSDIIALREEKTAALGESRKQRLIAQRLKEKVSELEKDMEVLQKKYEGKLAELSTVSKQHARALTGQSQALQKGKEKEKERAMFEEQREKYIEASIKTLSESLVSCEVVERGIIADLEVTGRYFVTDMLNNTLTAAAMSLQEKQKHERHSALEGVRLESKHQERVDAIVVTAKRDAEALMARVKDLESERDRLRGVAKTTVDKYLAALAEVETAHTELSVLSQQLGDAQTENERMSMLLLAAASEANKKSQQRSPQQVSLCEVGVDCRLPYPEQALENSSSTKREDKELPSNPRRLEEELDKLKGQMEPLQAEVMSARRREAAILKAASTDHTPSEAAESMLKALTGENERLVAIIRALQKKEKESKEKEAAERERKADTKATVSPVAEDPTESQLNSQSTSSAVHVKHIVPQHNNPPPIIETRLSKPLSLTPTLQDLAEENSSAAVARTKTEYTVASSHNEVRSGVDDVSDEQRNTSQGTINPVNASDAAQPPNRDNHYLDADVHGHGRSPCPTTYDGSRQPSPADSTTETLDFARKRLSVLEDALLRSVAEASRLQEESLEKDVSQKTEEWNIGAYEVPMNEMYNAFDRQRQRRVKEEDGQKALGKRASESLYSRRAPMRTARTPQRRGHAAEQHTPLGQSLSFVEAADRLSAASFDTAIRPDELADFRDSYAFPQNTSSGDGVGAPPPTSRPRTPRQPFSRRSSTVLIDSHTYSQRHRGAEQDNSHVSSRYQSSPRRSTPTRSLPPPPQTPAELGLQAEMRRWHEVVIKTGERLFPQTNASVRRGVSDSADVSENIETFEGSRSAEGAADRSFGFGSQPLGGDDGETSRGRATTSFRRDNSGTSLHYATSTPTYVESMSPIRQRTVRR